MYSDTISRPEALLYDKTQDRRYYRSDSWWQDPTNRAWWTSQIELGSRAHLSALWAGPFSVEEDQIETISYALRYAR